MNEYHISLLMKLLLSHLITDFLLQQDRNIKECREKKLFFRWLYLYGGIAGLLAYVFVAQWNELWIFPAVALSHVVIDGVKAMEKDTLLWFSLDQAAHILVILLVWYILLPSDTFGQFGHRLEDPQIWILVTAYFMILFPAGFFIGKATERWKKEIEPSNYEGLEKAGLWIGRMERFLILTFILNQEYSLVGLLIASKSILRFNADRKAGEYILIGTLASLTISAGVGLITLWLLNMTS